MSAATQPRVAVLMAVHRAADPRHFAQALDSIKGQTWLNLHIYLWCDGPLTQEHEQAISLIGASDCVMRSHRTVGLAAGLNALIERALVDPAVEFLARMDADDISLAQRIERQIQFMQIRPALSVCGTWIIEFTQPDVPLFKKKLPVSHEEARRFMIYRSPLAHPTVMFRRSVFEAGYRYDPLLLQAQDYELWSRLVLGGHVIGNVPEYLLWYRVAPDFYARRTGFRRAATELKERSRYARRSGLLRPHHLLGLVSLFFVRVAPVTVKRLAYRARR